MNEKQLIEGCCKGNKKQQKIFFDRFYPMLFRLARRYLADYHQAEDVVIIIFTKAFKSINHFEYRGEGSLKRWLTTIAINECCKTIKKIKPIYYQEEIVEVPIDRLENQIIDVELIHLILKKMPKGYRTVFNLYAIDGFTHSEIAEVLNISRNTSKSQLLKARKFIINELNKRKAYGT